VKRALVKRKEDKMYYEEKVIDGILHQRGLPGGEWIPFSAQGLTAIVENLRTKLSEFGDLNFDLTEALKKVHETSGNALGSNSQIGGRNEKETV
jgi:hypothetical protein